MQICLLFISTLRKIYKCCSLCSAQPPCKSYSGSDIDVKTRWNFKFKMRKLCLLLQMFCNHLFKDSAKTWPYILSSSKWDQCRYIMNLLETLSEATNLLCTSMYPILNSELPIYIMLIQHLKITQQGLRDQEQLVISAHEMINKIYQYLKDTIHKQISSRKWYRSDLKDHLLEESWGYYSQIIWN